MITIFSGVKINILVGNEAKKLNDSSEKISWDKFPTSIWQLVLRYVWELKKVIAKVFICPFMK